MKRQDQLEPNDVLVVNDVKRLSQKQKDWMLAAARAVKAKLVLVDETGFTTIEGEDVGMNAAQLAAFGGGER
jgi:DNA invertase Pin-like site-specific DNA recombinase